MAISKSGGKWQVNYAGTAIELNTSGKYLDANIVVTGPVAYDDTKWTVNSSRGVTYTGRDAIVAENSIVYTIPAYQSSSTYWTINSSGQITYTGTSGWLPTSTIVKTLSTSSGGTYYVKTTSQTAVSANRWVTSAVYVALATWSTASTFYNQLTSNSGRIYKYTGSTQTVGNIKYTQNNLYYYS